MEADISALEAMIAPREKHSPMVAGGFSKMWLTLKDMIFVIILGEKDDTDDKCFY